MARLRIACIVAALAVPAMAIAAGGGQDAATTAPAYELETPTHELARDCMNRMTRAPSGQINATVRCTVNDRGRLDQCELVDPTSDAQRQRRVLTCLAEAHRIEADDPAALQGEVIDVGLTIG